MWTKADKREAGFGCKRMWTSALVAGLPTSDFVNSGRLHSISQSVLSNYGS